MPLIPLFGLCEVTVVRETRKRDSVRTWPWQVGVSGKQVGSQVARSRRDQRSQLAGLCADVSQGVQLNLQVTVRAWLLRTP